MADPAWHQALAYAVLGRRLPELGGQDRPDVAGLAGRLREVGASGTTAPYAVPPDLLAGVGPAQFLAALTELRRQLAGPPLPAGPGAAGLTADDRRLLAEVPPHHGTP